MILYMFHRTHKSEIMNIQPHDPYICLDNKRATYHTPRSKTLQIFLNYKSVTYLFTSHSFYNLMIFQRQRVLQHALHLFMYHQVPNLGGVVPPYQHFQSFDITFPRLPTQLYNVVCTHCYVIQLFYNIYTKMTY